MDEYDPLKVPYKVKDKVKQKFKNYFGGRERVIAVGGAAVPKELRKFLLFCFDAIVTEGYGTTEVQYERLSITQSMCIVLSVVHLHRINYILQYMLHSVIV